MWGKGLKRRSFPTPLDLLPPIPLNPPLYSLSNGCRSIAGRIVTGKPSGHVPFQAHIELLRLFLTHREDIVESIEGVLNAQKKPIRYQQDRSLLSRHFEDCFFARTAVTASQARRKSAQAEGSVVREGEKSAQAEGSVVREGEESPQAEGSVVREGAESAQARPRAKVYGQPYPGQGEPDDFASGQSVVRVKELRGQLEEAHWAAGFRPRQVHYLHNDLIHPAEMMIRGFHFWHHTHWPGRNGRVHYAHTLFNLYVVRCLEFLSMRLWDEDPGSFAQGKPGERLAEIQGVLDELWRSSPADQPVIVRDARWLIPLAQSLITDELAPYFEVARQVTETLQEADRLAIRKAHVRMLGGHLTSQIRHYCTKDGVSINEHSVILRTRTSNALDFALLVQGLVELLKAYDRALLSGDERMRLDMAGAICQGISVDPELFLNRVDLLSAYSMIEHVFIATNSGGHVAYSPLGQRHVQLLKEYGALIDRLTTSLRDDLPRFRPVDGGYSPYGVIYGIPSGLIELMALKTLQRDAEMRFSLEDVFSDWDTSAAKLAWVDGWRKLPHIESEVQRLYDYPQQFAEDIYNRIEHELRRRDSNAHAHACGPEKTACDGSGTGRLHIVSPLIKEGDGPETDSKAAAGNREQIPELPARYFGSSDRQIVAAHKAEPYDQAHLLRECQEGHFLVSYETPGGWIALRKDLLTEVLGAGRDATIVGLPPDAAQVLRFMCTDLVCAGSFIPE